MDVQLAFDKKDKDKPTVLNLLRGKSITGHIYLRRVSMSEVPEDEEAAAKWLQDLYLRKDKLQTSFHETGDFFSASGIKPIEPIFIPPRKSSLINWVAWMFVTMIPILYLLLSMIVSGRIFYILIGVSITVAFYMLLNYAIATTRIAQGSSYGKKDGEEKKEQ